jgi:hypothetical protein
MTRNQRYPSLTGYVIGPDDVAEAREGLAGLVRLLAVQQAGKDHRESEKPHDPQSGHLRPVLVRTTE